MSKRFVCGWCQTGHYDDCIKEIKYFDKIWVCQSKEYQAEVLAKIKKQKKVK